jgi:hypothetical protein
MILPDEILTKFQSLEGKTNFEKMLGTVGILTYLLGEKMRPVIVGGLAVEIYTRSEYTTVDIDIILFNYDKAGEIFVSLGFKKQGRHWFHPELLVSIEIPNFILEDADPSRVVEILLPNDLKVLVIGIEDIILDRLRACVHWKSTSDCEWAERLYYLHKDRLDKNYLITKSKEDLTFPVLESILESINPIS